MISTHSKFSSEFLRICGLNALKPKILNNFRFLTANYAKVVPRIGFSLAQGDRPMLTIRFSSNKKIPSYEESADILIVTRALKKIQLQISRKLAIQIF